jgi:hypothetical protein
MTTVIKNKIEFAAFNDESKFRMNTAKIYSYNQEIETDHWCKDEETRTAYFIVINDKKKLKYFKLSAFLKDFEGLDSYFLNPSNRNKKK